MFYEVCNNNNNINFFATRHWSQNSLRILIKSTHKNNRVYEMVIITILILQINSHGSDGINERSKVTNELLEWAIDTHIDQIDGRLMVGCWCARVDAGNQY